MSDEQSAKPQPSAEKAGARSTHLLLLRIAVPVIVAAALLFAWRSGVIDLLSLETLRARRGELLGFVEANRALAFALFIGVYAVATLFAVPGVLWLTIAGGFLFGLLEGAIATSIAATLGATGLFLAARYLFADALRGRAGGFLERFEAGFRRNAISFLLTIRFVPVVPYLIANIAPAFLGVRTPIYIATTFIGILPGVVAYAWIGAGLGAVFDSGGTPDLASFARQLVPAFLVLGALSLTPVIIGRLRAKFSVEPATSGEESHMNDNTLIARRRLKADVAIIGAGSAGLVAASGAAQLGLKVVLFEKSQMGGDCLNFGCVPSKALIAASRAAQSTRDARELGISAELQGVDWAAISAHVQGVIEAIAPADSQERFEKLGVTVIREAARFLDRTTLASKNVEVRARKIVVATGARAFIPQVPGLDQVTYLTNETVFTIAQLPERLIILGGGAVGVELGQAFRRLGAEVVIIETEEILASADAEAREIIRQRLVREGVVLCEETRALRVSNGTVGVEVLVEGEGGEETIGGSHLLVAVGRRPVVEGLDLERGGIAHDARGVRTDSRLRTTNPRVWAVGDVAGRDQFTHAAGFHGGLFIRNALFRLSRARVDSVPMPRVVYTEPELAQVGLNESDARARYGGRVRVVRWDYEHNDRARTERAYEGFAKIVTGPSGKILGAVVIGDGAGETIALLQFAIANKLRIGALASNFVPPYPTRAEIVKRAAGQHFADALFSKTTRTAVKVLSRLP